VCSVRGVFKTFFKVSNPVSGVISSCEGTNICGVGISNCELSRTSASSYSGPTVLWHELAPFQHCFHTTIADVQYSRQLADSYSPVVPNECIDVVSVLACYGSPRPTVKRFVLHRFPSFFKRTAPLIDTNS